jgi:hypothetical protein
MVMIGWQDDGTMGPNINSSIIPPKPGSTAALARQANSGGIAAAEAAQKLQNRQSAGQQASTPKEETQGTGTNSGAVGSLGASSGMGVAGTSQAGLVGSVNTEVQNDDVLLPYQKI